MSELTTLKTPIRHSLITCTSNNKEVMRILVNNCFPLTYKDEFYERVARIYSEHTRFITLNDIIVGGVSCRVETEENETGTPFLHVLILLVLDPYRRLGLAGLMFDWVLAAAKKSTPKLAYISLHVQKINQAAIGFYLKKGFTIIEEVADYYTEIEGPDALFMKLML